MYKFSSLICIMFVSLMAFQSANAMKRTSENDGNAAKKPRIENEIVQNSYGFNDEAAQLNPKYLDVLDEILASYLPLKKTIENGHHLMLYVKAGEKIDNYFHLEPPEFQQKWKDFLRKMRNYIPNTRIFCTKTHQLVLDRQTASREDLQNKKISIVAELKNSENLEILAEFYLKDLRVHKTEIDPLYGMAIDVSVIGNLAAPEKYKGDSFVAILYTDREIAEILLNNITTCWEDNLYILLSSEHFCGIHPPALLEENMRTIIASSERGKRLYAAMSAWKGNPYWYEMAEKDGHCNVIAREVSFIAENYNDGPLKYFAEKGVRQDFPSEAPPPADFEILAESASARGFGSFAEGEIYTNPFYSRVD